MVKITIAFDTGKTASEFAFGWIFHKFIVPVIKLRECIYFEITDDEEPVETP